MVAVIGLWIAIGLLALAILCMVISGIRGMVNGSVNLRKVAMMLLPAVIWLVILLITGSWMMSGLVTGAIMLALMILAIVGTGVRGVFS